MEEKIRDFFKFGDGSLMVIEDELFSVLFEGR